jgi:hypothetical protein
MAWPDWAATEFVGLVHVSVYWRLWRDGLSHSDNSPNMSLIEIGRALMASAFSLSPARSGEQGL